MLGERWWGCERAQGGHIRMKLCFLPRRGAVRCLLRSLFLPPLRTNSR